MYWKNGQWMGLQCPFMLNWTKFRHILIESSILIIILGTVNDWYLYATKNGEGAKNKLKFILHFPFLRLINPSIKINIIVLFHLKSLSMDMSTESERKSDIYMSMSANVFSCNPNNNFINVLLSLKRAIIVKKFYCYIFNKIWLSNKVSHSEFLLLSYNELDGN